MGKLDIDSRSRAEKFSHYILKRWFISAIKTTWKLTHNPVIARMAAEDAGRKIFDDLIEKQETWTPELWIEAVKKCIDTLCDVETEFLMTNDAHIKMNVKQCFFPDVMKEDRFATCSFCYGTWGAIFKKAFPKGELLLSELISKGASCCEFGFLRSPSEEDILQASADLRRMFLK
ncbi:MAG: hypothetical protein V3T58_04480 [Candidatus Hydrothermarchaeales archaeon]